MPPAKTFIETQFPVSKLSKESYKERKAVSGQTLTGLGKWWGRKPLVMVRGVILGLLMPASDNPKKDTDIFLKIMTMDDDGLWRRLDGNIPAGDLYPRLSREEQQKYFSLDSRTEKPKLNRGVSAEKKEELQRKVFIGFSYDEKLEYCLRPEHIDGPSPEAWREINAHLGTSANSFEDLVHELGARQFGRVPRVGDTFCGGGNIPFEAARLGCEAYGADLSPIAGLLTWGSLNIVGGGKKAADRITKAQERAFKKVDKQITEWKIEHNKQGWRADAYLHCTETICPECGWKVPLAPSWVVADKNNVIANLVPVKSSKSFSFEIIEGASKKEYETAKEGTLQNSGVVCPNLHCKTATPISTIRGDGAASTNGSNLLRPWTKEDVVPRAGDIYQERLYCVRWLETYTDKDGETKTRRHYRAPSDDDLRREQKVLELVRANLADWQRKGYVPQGRIEEGVKTTEPIRTRGWTFWHHLFGPRQLLLNGLFAKAIGDEKDTLEKVALLLLVGRLADWNSKLSVWLPGNGGGIGGGKNTFLNQAFNTLMNYSVRPFLATTSLQIPERSIDCSKGSVNVGDSRNNEVVSDLWITDPPYADAVVYHELSELFLSIYTPWLKVLFPAWYTDSKRALAIRGEAESFRIAMVECYRNLAEHMPENGIQVVMFTHQDASVWADLALILWAAGLSVTAAWTIATETGAGGLRKGNYVQGTVLLVLRKRTSEEVGFLDEIISDIKPEVERQLASMLALDERDDPNFTDSDYQLAAYAAALRVLTQYKRIEEIDVERELSRQRSNGDRSPIEAVIENAVKIASNFLIPRGLHDDEATRRDLWRNLSAEEKFYTKGLDIESHGDLRQGVYQEFARGFGLREYTNLLESIRANETRLKTATEFKRKDLGSPGFGSSLLRNILFAVCMVGETERIDEGMRWLKDEISGDYWPQRSTIVTILRYLAKLPMDHWKEDSEAARILAGAVENDNV
ncbi:DUF1156 domain-containing protein [bacterium]|nr:DUF1156 domain-containing protein [bacterium]